MTEAERANRLYDALRNALDGLQEFIVFVPTEFIDRYAYWEYLSSTVRALHDLVPEDESHHAAA